MKQLMLGITETELENGDITSFARHPIVVVVIGSAASVWPDVEAVIPEQTIIALQTLSWVA
jgi:hypothetical protein